jgi:hypothetical protein
MLNDEIEKKTYIRKRKKRRKKAQLQWIILCEEEYNSFSLY